MLSSFLAFKRALKRPCILDTNKSNINPETEKDDNTSLHEMVIDDNFDKDTNTGIFLHIIIMQYDFI